MTDIEKMIGDTETLVGDLVTGKRTLAPIEHGARIQATLRAVRQQLADMEEQITLYQSTTPNNSRNT